MVGVVLLLVFVPLVAFATADLVEVRLIETTRPQPARHAQASWSGVAQRLGLRYAADKGLWGAIDGLPVRVDVTQKPYETIVSVLVDVGLHAAAQAFPGARPSGNPVLDALIHTRVDQDLSAEAVEALLAVVHRFPGSTVSTNGVSLRVPGIHLDIEPLIVDAVRLAAALRDSR